MSVEGTRRRVRGIFRLAQRKVERGRAADAELAVLQDAAIEHGQAAGAAGWTAGQAWAVMLPMTTERAVFDVVAGGELKDVILDDSPGGGTGGLFVAAFGAYGWTRVAVLADSIFGAELALGPWLADSAPGLLAELPEDEEERAQIEEAGYWEDHVELGEVGALARASRRERRAVLKLAARMASLYEHAWRALAVGVGEEARVR